MFALGGPELPNLYGQLTVVWFQALHNCALINVIPFSIPILPVVISIKSATTSSSSSLNVEASRTPIIVVVVATVVKKISTLSNIC